MNKYIESQSMAAGPITNDDLICKHCKFKHKKSAICDVYDGENGFKPSEVLNGGDCKYFSDKDMS